MSLDLPRILPQMQEIGRLASSQAETIATLLPEAETSFIRVAKRM